MTRLLYICNPNEGSSSRARAASPLATGRVVGYQIIKGGRRVRRPLIEAVDRMISPTCPSSWPSPARIPKAAFAQRARIANVKARRAAHARQCHRALLGVDRARIMAVAKETLEGKPACVLATLTPEEVNADKIKFASRY